MAIIENALRQVMNQGSNYLDMTSCREVLTKLQNVSLDHLENEQNDNEQGNTFM